MTNDTISDMLTRIRNGNLVGHKVVKIDSTRLNYQLIKLLYAEGLIKQYETVKKDNRRFLFVYLKYSVTTKKPILRGLKRVSKPGLRIYAGCHELPNVLEGHGLAVLSTSKGIMTNLKAKSLGIGGEILCYVW